MRACKVCAKKIKPPKRQAGINPQHYLDDPYCSRKCCEQDHGVTHLTGHTSLYPEAVDG